MIPEKTLSALRTCLMLASKTLAIPYDWDKKGKKLIAFKQKRWIWLWYSIKFLHFLHLLFLIISLFFQSSNYYMLGEDGIQSLMIHALFCVIFITTNLLSISYYFFADENQAFLNALLQLNSEGNHALK